MKLLLTAGCALAFALGPALPALADELPGTPTATAEPTPGPTADPSPSETPTPTATPTTPAPTTPAPTTPAPTTPAPAPTPPVVPPAPGTGAIAFVVGNPLAHAGEVLGVGDTSPYLGRTSGYRPSIFMVGDSITAHSLGWLRRRHATWEITAVPGRNVGTLPYYVKDRLANRSRLTTVVFALGTNAQPGWTLAQYAAAAALLPPSTRVVLVTTYRDPGLFPATTDYRRRSSIQSYYSSWMRAIARSRPHTCVAEWRNYVIPRHAALLVDGVHPNAAGEQAISWLVVKAVAGCR